MSELISKCVFNSLFAHQLFFRKAENDLKQSVISSVMQYVFLYTHTAHNDKSHYEKLSTTTVCHVNNCGLYSNKIILV